jgi:DNA-binding transcriptional MocR family regulator
MKSQSTRIGTFTAAVRSVWDVDGPGRLRDSLAAAMRDSIEAGRLPGDGKLPPERVLAERLGVSRATVVAAYSALVRSGILVRRTGSGTFVLGPRSAGGGSTVSRLADNPLLSNVEGGADHLIDFRIAAPEADESVIPALQRAISELPLLAGRHGYVTAGWEPLRVAIAEHLTARGLRSDPAHILVTNGAQQAIDLAVTAHVDPGDTVLVENPTYPGALDVLRRANAAVVAAPAGITGVRSDQVRELAARIAPRLFYVSPTFNNPTGAVVPAPERQRLAELADRFDFTLVEDLTLAELCITGSTPPPPIGSFSRTGRVISIGSFSKLFWGGLRLGWVRASVPRVARMMKIKAVTDLSTALPLQVAGRQLLAVAGEVTRRRQEQLAKRHALLDQLLETWLPSWRRTSPAGGVTIWARLPFGDAEVLARHARDHGVAIVPGTHFSIDGSTSGYVRLPFALPPQVLEAGVRRLAEAWREFEAGRAEPGSSTPLV